MIQTNYTSQVALLIRVLPVVMEEEKFCVKGGTAINLFVRNMPRLSVDIDLTYLPIESRVATLNSIDLAFDNIAKKVNYTLKNSNVNIIKDRNGNARQIIVFFNQTKVKIETNNVFRGTVFPYQEMEICKRAQDQFEFFTTARILSFEDLYAGKICAALDRQHPRDLFDIKILLDNEGISDNLRKTFIIYLISNNRPIVELIDPKPQMSKVSYEEELIGMGDSIPSFNDLIDSHQRLISINENGSKKTC